MFVEWLNKLNSWRQTYQVCVGLYFCLVMTNSSYTSGGELSNLICIIAICISVFTAQLLFLLAPWPMSGYAIWKTWVLVAFHNSPMKYAPRFGSLSETSLLREVIAAILVAGYSVWKACTQLVELSIVTKIKCYYFPITDKGPCCGLLFLLYGAVANAASYFRFLCKFQGPW